MCASIASSGALQKTMYAIEQRSFHLIFVSSANCGIQLWEIVMILLQDEDETIREAAAVLVSSCIQVCISYVFFCY